MMGSVRPRCTHAATVATSRVAVGPWAAGKCGSAQTEGPIRSANREGPGAGRTAGPI